MLSQISTNKIRSIFQRLGLDKEHAQTYIASLQLGNTSASKIAKKTGLPRSSTYYLLYDLEKIGLISQIESESKKLFSPNPPDQLQELIASQEIEIEKTKIDLKSVEGDLSKLFNSKQEENAPQVSVFHGDSGLKTVLYDCFKADIVYAYCQEGVHYSTSLDDEPKYLQDFLKQISHRDISFQEIVYDNSPNQEYKEQFESDKHEIMLIPANKELVDDHVDKQIYLNRVAYISHKNKLGIIIEDKTIAKSEKIQFMDLWQYHKKRSKSPSQQ